IKTILDAGEQVLVGRGMAHTSVADVAADAGIGVGSVYHYFADKRALLDWVVLRVLLPDVEIPAELPLGRPPTTITEAVARYHDLRRALPVLHRVGASPLDGAMHDELAILIGEFCDLIARTDRVQTLVEVTSNDIEELRRAWYIGYRRNLVAAYERYLRRRIDEGALRPLDDPTFAARWLIDTVVLFLRLQRLDPYPAELPADGLRDHLVDMLVGGFAGPARPLTAP
ncbi:MAG TPA: helix-turn-helix domain-containing protein, partial [Actinomycetes bacterium]|nr:helix-turn-helix domain-containing protein [Actinomycetes bacterium]